MGLSLDKNNVRIAGQTETVINVSLTDTAADGGFTISPTEHNSFESISLDTSAKTITLKPKADQTESNIEFTVTSNTEGSDTATLTVDLVPTPTLTVTPAEDVSITYPNGNTQVFEVNTNRDSYEATVTPTELGTYDNGSSTFTANQEGTGTITFVVDKDYDSKVEVVKNVTVEASALEATTVTLTPNSITARVEGEEVEVAVSTDATDYTLDGVENDIVSVREDKENKKFYVSVKATEDGYKPKDSTTITVKATADGKAEGSASLTVTLEDKQFVTELSIEPESVTMQVGAESTVVVTTNADDFTFSITDSGKVTFDKASRKLTALAAGSSSIIFSAKYRNGETVTKTLTVNVEAVPVIETTLEVTPNKEITLVKGDKQLFQVVTNAEDYEVELSNPAIATYSKADKTLSTTESGTLKLTFKATRKDSIEKTVEVTVVINEVRLTADLTSVSVNKGETVSFAITSNVIADVQANVSEYGYVAVSKNSNIITVEAIAVGEVDIVLTARGVTLTIPVKVTDITSLSVAPQVPNMITSDTYQAVVTTNAATFVVEVNDPEVIKASIEDKTITLKPLKAGSVIITVKAKALGGEEVVVSWPVTVIEQSNYTDEQAASILTDPTTTVAEKLRAFKNDIGKFGKYVANLTKYNEVMSPNLEETISDEKGAARNYSLYIQIKDTCSKEDYKEFKTEFDIINMVYLNYANDSFDEFALFRFDQAWTAKWGEVSLTTFQNLNTIICTLCDIKTRASNLSGISLDKSLDPNELELDEIAISNIKKYYEV